MNIRPGIVSDIPPIMEIVSQVVAEMNANGNFQWTDEYPRREVFEDDIKDESLFAGIIDDKLAAFIVLNENQPTEYKPINWRTNDRALIIHRFAVDSAARGHGVADSMEKFACKLARSKGLSAIRTDTNSSNTAMQGFLKHCDYKQSGILFFEKCDNPFYCFDKLLG